MRYILPILALLALLFSCTAETHNQPLTYDHTTPRQLGKILPRTLIGSDSIYKTKWVFFENYTMCLDYADNDLLGVEIDHRIGESCSFEMTECCFDIVIDRPDTCWWWQQLPNHIRSEISSRKISTY
jgi:hypothetical protein